MKMKSLTASDFPATQTSIGKSEFANRTDLVSVELPATITEIGDFAFEKCYNLERIVIPDSVKKIGSHCFDGCISLRECNRPAALKQADGNAFFNTPLVQDTRYIPAPIDTSDVELTPDIMELCELLAKNTHEVWSETRIKDGWSYGEERNDANKKHPCLVPYEELSEAEKEYDRNTSIQTLKLIAKLGYHISK